MLFVADKPRRLRCTNTPANGESCSQLLLHCSWELTYRLRTPLRLTKAGCRHNLAEGEQECFPETSLLCHCKAARWPIATHTEPPPTLHCYDIAFISKFRNTNYDGSARFRLLCLHRRSIAFSPLVYYVRLAWQQENNSADRLPEHLTLPALPSKNVFLFASSITAVIMTPLWFLSGSINK